MSFRDCVERMREQARSPVEKGSWFEKATVEYLRQSNLWNIKNVVLWKNWKYKDGGDTGIDVVAETQDGELCAVQCKMYGEEHRLAKTDIDSFLEKSSRPYAGNHNKPFTHKIIAYIGAKISNNAYDAMLEHGCVLLTESNFENCEIDWQKYMVGEIVRKSKFEPKPHQKIAIKDVLEGFNKFERGMLIMACGTGKTYTSLRIAEKICNESSRAKTLLYLVPSISLMRQTIQEWGSQQNMEARYMAVCSDKKVTKDSEDSLTLEIPIPVTTETKLIRKFIIEDSKNHSIIFCTYHSLKHIVEAQKSTKHRFDLIICDEAHRTTGAEYDDETHSKFTLVHDNERLKAYKRLYMTATDRIYTEDAKEKAEIRGAKIHSMDDVQVFGPEFHRLKFSEAIDKNLLTDYRVLVLNVGEKQLYKTLKKKIGLDFNEINVDDSVKMIGCWKALKNPEWSSKRKSEPLKKAIAYTSRISRSENFTKKFPVVTDDKFRDIDFRCEVKHVSGLQNALERGEALIWLKEDARDEEQTVCKILSNAKCLGEGIDVPALDAIMFLQPRRSAVEIVQAVGRVMRKPHNLQGRKKFGYVILPIVVPSDKTPETALDSNERYRVVWEVLRALRSHDDELDRSINQWRYKETTGLKEALKNKVSIGEVDDEGNIVDISDREDIIPLESIRTKIVEKVGTRDYWGGWTQDIIAITQKIRTRMNNTVKRPKPKAKFEKFVESLQKTLNETVTKSQALDMLTQHIVTVPIFETLFDKGSFNDNPISKIMNEVLVALDFNKVREAEELKPFYDKITNKVQGLGDDPKARQELIKDLYGDFFEIVFKNEAKNLGIVYTPIQVVDFILRSTDYAMKKHFGKYLTQSGVNIIDPFTGTGSFLTRFLDETIGLLKHKDAARKYEQELHANEITLMGYYIASVNIASTFTPNEKNSYKIFPGLLFTDTFKQSIPVAYPEIAKKLTKQKQKKIEVIVGNPPYSDRKTVAQYTDLTRNIRTHYGKGSGVNDSYIRAFMWATDRLQRNGNKGGIIAFVTNSGFVSNNSLDKMRESLEQTFSHIYILDLRGDQQKTRGEDSKNEGGKIFGGGSRQPITITILIKNPVNRPHNCQIKYYKVPDKQTRVDKLRLLENLSSIENIQDKKSQYKWEKIIPNRYNDWVDQRNDYFETYTPLQEGVFLNAVRGILSARVGWVYNSSKATLSENMIKSVDYIKTLKGTEPKEKIDIRKLQPSGQILDKIKKLQSTKANLSVGFKHDNLTQKIMFKPRMIEKVFLKPFLPQWHYSDPLLNDNTSLSEWFRHGKNVIICVSDKPKGFSFSAVAVDRPVDIKFLYNAICFPRYKYTISVSERGKKITKVSNISEKFRKEVQNVYNSNSITDDDLFCYVYAVLNSKQYQNENRNNLKRMVARIPLVDNLQSFMKFVKAGKKLLELHVNWIEKLDDQQIERTVMTDGGGKEEDWKIDTRDFHVRGFENNNEHIKINQKTSLRGIPQATRTYAIEGRTPLEWLISHWGFSIQGMKNVGGVRHYESGVVNDINNILKKPSQIKNYIAVLTWMSVETEKIVDSMERQKWITINHKRKNLLSDYL